MRILVTNDDGIYSPGIAALARVAQRFGEVRVVAPDVEQSSMGHAITATRPLSYRETQIGGFEAYRVNGTPADCVALGAYCWDRVDVVLSGINLGLNIGNGMWHSGTLAAAKQAALLGLQGIAFSTPVKGGQPRFEMVEPWAARVLERVLGDPRFVLLNVNLPAKPRGMVWTQQSVRHYDGEVVPGDDPMGRRHYWMVVRPVEALEEGTDRWAVRRGFVSLTPLDLNLTHQRLLSEVRNADPLDWSSAAAADADPRRDEDD